MIDTLNEYHNLYNGTIDILSRNEFKGKATYELVSASDTFAIELTDFRREEVQESRRKTALHTVADGQVQENQNVIISPGMLYRGQVRMHATKEALELDGEVKLDFKNVPGYNTWISYSSDAGQKQLIFDFDNSQTDQGEPLVAGLHLGANDNSIYSTFVTDRRRPTITIYLNRPGRYRTMRKSRSTPSARPNARCLALWPVRCLPLTKTPSLLPSRAQLT